MPTLNELRDSIHRNAVEHGFYDEELKPHSEAVHQAFVAQRIALIHSELSETLEAIRKGKYASSSAMEMSIGVGALDFDRVFEQDIKDSVEDEIADALIRILDLCGAEGIDIDQFVRWKMRYNGNRKYKHGKKF